MTTPHMPTVRLLYRPLVQPRDPPRARRGRPVFRPLTPLRFLPRNPIMFGPRANLHGSHGEGRADSRHDSRFVALRDNRSRSLQLSRHDSRFVALRDNRSRSLQLSHPSSRYENPADNRPGNHPSSRKQLRVSNHRDNHPSSLRRDLLANQVGFHHSSQPSNHCRSPASNLLLKLAAVTLAQTLA